MFKKIFFIVLFSIIFLVSWSVLIEPNIVVIEEPVLDVEDLPVEWEDATIVHLTDFHSRGFDGRERKVLKILDKLNPDFIFITGDIVDWSTKDLESCQEFWKEICKNREGKVFGVLGNHDHRNVKFHKLPKVLEESGIEILYNESIIIEHNQKPIYLIGVDDPHLGYDDLEKAMEQVDGNFFKILLAHSPEIFRKVKDKNIDVVLVGHTHGCQMNIPFLRNYFLPLNYDKQYKRGIFKQDNTYMYVNRGIGTTALPIRLNALPEVALIRLK